MENLFPTSLTYSFIFFIAIVLAIGFVFQILPLLIKKYIAKRRAENITNPKELMDLTPDEFEKMVVALYQAMGHEAKQIGRPGKSDHGIDVLVNAKNGEKWIIQCKRWSGWVGEPVIRDIYGTMIHEKAAQSAIITSGTFSNAARKWANGKPIALYDGQKFLELWEQAKK